MALTTTRAYANSVTCSAAQAASDAARWQLHGHDGEVLGACSRGSMFATCDVRGVVLVWRCSADAHAAVEHVCAVATDGPAVLDVAFTSATQLATAQGDGVVGLWNVERGVRQRTIARCSADRRRGNWPVINAVATLADGNDAGFAYGGDDGYLVRCDARTAAAVVSTVNLHAPITALCTAQDAIFVGDAAGMVHKFDVRLDAHAVASVACASDVVAGLACRPHDDTAVVACAMDDTAVLLDMQPFALSDAERVVGCARVHHDEERCLRRCAWSCALDAIVVPSPGGVVEQLCASHFAASAPRVVTVGRGDAVMRVALFVQDKFLLCGGRHDLVLCAWR